MGQLSCSVCNTNIWETVNGMGQLSCSVCNINIWETVGWDGTAVVFSV